MRTACKTLLFAALCGAWATTPGAAQEPATQFRAGALEVAINGRVQTLFSTTSAEDAVPTAWEFRRVRMEFRVKVNEVISGRIQPDFAGDRVSLKDTYMLFTFSPALQVYAGKTYRPFGLLAQTSSIRILPIERGARIRGVDDAFEEYNLIADLEYGDRELGLQARGQPEGAPLGFGYGIGIFSGPLDSVVGERPSFQLAARGTIEPVEKIRIGAGWSMRDFARGPIASDVETELERGHAVEIDLEYGSFSPGLHLLAEATTGDFDPLSGREFRGAQLWSAYRIPASAEGLTAWEPTFRASYGEVDPNLEDSGGGGTLLTPGLSLYFGELNRVMLNWDFWQPDGGGDDVNSFKVMFQVAF